MKNKLKKRVWWEWNYLERSEDVSDGARYCDEVYSYGGLWFLVQNYLNNIAVVRVGEGGEVIEAFKALFDELYSEDKKLVTICTGRRHHTYDILRRYMRYENIHRVVGKDITSYIIWIGEREWRK